MDTQERIAALAKEAASFFRDGPRESTDTGRTIRTVRYGAPEWVTDLCRAAHDDARLFPDDWRYEFIEAALDALADSDGDYDEAQELLDTGFPAYAQLTMWLGSHSYRADYCDTALKEYGSDVTDGIMRVLALGQHVEREEVLQQVFAFLEDKAEEDEAND